MEGTPEQEVNFPKGLIEWAGHHSGGVKRLFDASSGRPGKELLRTSLISRLESWVKDVVAGVPSTPRILLLVGGPGNGKTEAIEHTINCLDVELDASGKLLEELSASYHPPVGQPVPRLVEVDAGILSACPRSMLLSIVQDASATAGKEKYPAPELLISELLDVLESSSERYYLCCVNRGVLDDALIHALDRGLDEASKLLETITRSVSLSPAAPSCWPLDGCPEIAVWPMDTESLLICPDDCSPSPGSTLLAHATAPQYWPAPGTCQAGNACPFCHSQSILARGESRAALLRILRWYELGSGKRWSFRDLFSLTSYLLAGNRTSTQGQHSDPCQWAATLVQQAQDGENAGKPKRHQLTASFYLATAAYQHALFHFWSSDAAKDIRQGMRDLNLDKETSEARTLLGLLYFLQDRKTSYLPATIAPLVDSMSALLDPAMASPDLEVAVSGKNKILLGELDTRFSRSIEGGIDFVRKYHVLGKAELDLLLKLSNVDRLLSSPTTRRKHPAAANRLQHILRDFSCRLVRRSICTRSAVVADAKILDTFQQIVEADDNGQRLSEVAKQVKTLLNTGQNFEVSLTTTFGQPLPPRQRQAILVAPSRPVKMRHLSEKGRPRSPLCFLDVGSGKSPQPIALTYELFKAVKELERHLSQASLPRTVVALLDTTRARLSGPIVRDPDILSDATIRIGTDGTEISSSWNGGFVSAKEGRTP